jgi:hypothetical protein
MVWNREGIVPKFPAFDNLISLLWRLPLSGAYNICFLNFHHAEYLLIAQNLWASPDSPIAPICRECATARCTNRIVKMSTASIPKLNHEMSLNSMLIFWETPFKLVANGAIVPAGSSSEVVLPVPLMCSDTVVAIVDCCIVVDVSDERLAVPENLEIYGLLERLFRKWCVIKTL